MFVLFIFQNDIKNLKHDTNILHRESKGELGSKKKWKLKDLEERYRVRKKGIYTVMKNLSKGF